MLRLIRPTNSYATSARHLWRTSRRATLVEYGDNDEAEARAAPLALPFDVLRPLFTSSQPSYKLTFGKYEGKTLAEVGKHTGKTLKHTGKSYLAWLVNQSEGSIYKKNSDLHAALVGIGRLPPSAYWANALIEMSGDTRIGLTKMTVPFKPIFTSSYTLTFGKYEGKTLDEAPKSYVTWLAEEGCHKMHSDLHTALVGIGQLKPSAADIFIDKWSEDIESGIVYKEFNIVGRGWTRVRYEQRGGNTGGLYHGVTDDDESVKVKGKKKVRRVKVPEREKTYGRSISAGRSLQEEVSTQLEERTAAVLEKHGNESGVYVIRPHMDMFHWYPHRFITDDETLFYKIGKADILKKRFNDYTYPFVTLVHFSPSDWPLTVEWLTFKIMTENKVKSAKGQSREVVYASLEQSKAAVQQASDEAGAAHVKLLNTISYGSENETISDGELLDFVKAGQPGQWWRDSYS
jgi:uncharacterized protein (DUF3820 family)